MSNIDKQALREAAEKFRATYAAHRQNPRNYEALDAWDKATNEFQQLVNNDELNIIASLLGELEGEAGRIKELESQRQLAFMACNRWSDKFREAERRLSELEARTVDLCKRSVGEVMHMSGFSRDYAEGWCAGNDNARHEIRAAGISIKGSE